MSFVCSPPPTHTHLYFDIVCRLQITFNVLVSYYCFVLGAKIFKSSLLIWRSRIGMM